MAIKRIVRSGMRKAPAQEKTPDNYFNIDEVDGWFTEEEDLDDADIGEEAPSQSIVEKYNKSQLRVVRETKDYTLDYLQHALKIPSYIINVQPDYQRRQRWSAKKRSLLIESFLMNIPIPPVFLYEREYNSYEVVDGRQRLDTIRDFLDNAFALTGLKYWPELNGKRYQKLPSIIQKGLLRRSIGAVVLLAETRKLEDDDVDVRTILFDRLNTGGEKLNPQELRNALYAGSFNRLLLSLAATEEFTSAWGIPSYSNTEDASISDSLGKNTLYRTMADCELVLRFFAIREAITDQARGSLRKLLDRTMARHQNDEERDIRRLREQYMSALRGLKSIFGSATFVLPKTRKPSRPLYDALMVAYSLGIGTWDLLDSRTVKSNLARKLRGTKTYDVLVGRGNTLDSIRERVQLASEILFGED